MIPLIITMDLEIAKDYSLDQQRLALRKINNSFDELKLQFTTFTTSEASDYFPDELKAIQSNGNEIGCHGLNHGSDENYKTLNANTIYSNIQSSTDNIVRITSASPTSFRGPGMSTSVNTQKVLINSGYKSDFSVCPQRLDFMHTKGGDIGWLFASRLPYNPSEVSPYRKGNLPLWVVPLSCIGFPFISGILYIFGLRFMKFFFRMLLRESLKNNKPIVYIFHSYEFAEYTGSKELKNDKSGINRNKRSFIHRLYSSEPEARYSINLEFIKYMLSFDNVKPFTGNKFTEKLISEIR
jgi:peptidoglycan/xylan/chitin deacetylase (PgdA/CDA1 family)